MRFAANVAVYVALVKDERIFLLRRANTGYRDGEWAMPAGHVESGETPTQAAMRELREETGVIADLSDVRFAHALYRLCGELRDRAYVDFLFICKSWSGEPRNEEPAKADACGWFDLDGLSDIVDFHAAMLTRAREGLAHSEFHDR